MKIDTDDLVLFASIALAGIGAALVTVAITGDAVAAIGVAFLLIGIPSALITFLAAAEDTK